MTALRAAVYVGIDRPMQLETLELDEPGGDEEDEDGSPYILADKELPRVMPLYEKVARASGDERMRLDFLERRQVQEVREAQVVRVGFRHLDERTKPGPTVEVDPEKGKAAAGVC
jgi:hypothetical protein